MKVVTVLNFKGGVAKTTSVCTLAQITSMANKKVLFLDTDPQCDASKLLGIRPENSPSIYTERLFCEELKDASLIKGMIIESNFPGIDIIPANEELKEVEKAIYEKSKTCNVDVFLRHNLNLLSDEYDYVFIDTNPSDNYFSPCTIAAANEVLSPVTVDGFSYDGLEKLIHRISDISLKYSIDTSLKGVFFTRVFEREVVSRQLRDSYQSVFGDYFIPVYIRRCVAVDESNTTSIPLWEYDKKCTSMRDYVYLAKYLGYIDNKTYRSFYNELFEEGGK